MATTTASSNSKARIRASLTQWQGAIPDPSRALFATFVDVTLSRLRGPFLAQHRPTAVLALLEEAFLFALHRPYLEVRAEIRRHPKGIAALVNMPDQPFIVDTVRLFLKTRDSEYQGGFNLVFDAARDSSGTLIDVGDGTGTPESLVLLESDTGRLDGDLASASQLLRLNLEHARAMVSDFGSMTRTVERFAERCEVLAERRPDTADAMRETSAFLKWLLNENFVFLGVDGGAEPLGIQKLSGPYHNNSEGAWPPPQPPHTVRVRKSHIESPVHRSGRIDEIMLTVGNPGDPTAMQLFLRGMFTYRAVTQPSRNVPILRAMLGEILSEQTASPGSFRYKGIANVFDSLPTEFLFTATKQAIAEMVDLVFEAEHQQDVGVTFMMSAQDSAFCLVAMPKRQYDDELRRSLEDEIVRTTRATYADHGLFVGRYDSVLLHYYLTGVQYPGEQEIQRLTDLVRKQATPWGARLWNALAERFGDAQADRLADTYGRAFPEEWVRNNPVDRTVRDIEMLEGLSTTRVQAALYEYKDELYLRVYQSTNVHLSELMPVLSNLGIQTVDSQGTVVQSRGGSLYIDTFRLLGDREQLLKHASLICEAITRLFDGSLTDDELNALIVEGLSWRQVDMIRSYARYLRQIPVAILLSRVRQILLENAAHVKAVVRLFEARFDPTVENREAAVTAADDDLKERIRLIASQEEDLTFSTFRTLVLATMRTNYYRTDRPYHYLSFKLEGSRIPALGEHPPLYEVFVHARDVEGVHMRFGMVARGGLRWSDRDDFRTEVLGLVTTQQVKNVVIVPTGSKGGFILKNAPRDRGARRAMADEKYKTFIRGLLDITDNYEGTDVVPPPRVVRHDTDDPYLVVAADKGTAHLSDTANALSVGYGYWLGDGFASGGSNGYDHKKVGITARGAWVLVRRHFAERGIDPYTTPFTCVGVGDMGGDVFGNGLLESPHAKLLGAFNHLHIFIDPDPDPVTTHAERQRLFGIQGGWDQYDASLISQGGGVFERRAKKVDLSPRAQAMLGLETATPTPEMVINAMLKMDVDLLWNGGIGTYVKASHESHEAADDRGNNALRIDATELRASILGEGGNLGFTQESRIEAGLHGVRLNTDAIDNSAGVDMSDHEVNLKILLNQVVRRGGLTEEQRNVVLEEMTEEVADLVLANNDANGRQLSRDQLRSRRNIYAFGRAITFVEGYFDRDRETLRLPGSEELDRRAAEGLGLTRPELAVLSAWVKMFVQRELVEHAKTLPGYQRLLHEYFPQRIQANYAADIDGHMLADEIAATVATTRMVTDGGAALFPAIIDATGATVPEVAQAYLKAQVLSRANAVRGTLEELRTTVSLSDLYEAWVELDTGTREVAMFWLSARGTIPSDDLLEEMKDVAQRVYDMQPSDVIDRNQAKFDALLSKDIPEDVARRIMRAQYLNIALTVWAESKRTGSSFSDIAVKHLAIGRATRLQEVLDDLSTRPAQGQLGPIALRILHTRFHGLLRSVIRKLPELTYDSVDQLEGDLTSGVLADVRSQVDGLLPTDRSPDVATLLVLEERVAATIQRIDA